MPTVPSSVSKKSNRSADAVVEKSNKRLGKFSLVATTQIKLWKASIAMVFIAGFVGALTFAVGTEFGRKNIHQDELLAASGANCSNTSVGQIPINDLGMGYYRGYQGGLYPGGINTIPEAHAHLGMQMVKEIVPRNANGNIDLTNGKIVLTSFGVSNTRNKFSGCNASEEGKTFCSTYPDAFKPRADADSEKNPAVVIVNGAQGSRPLSDWSTEASVTWDTLNSWLAAAGVTPLQVQVAWIELPDKTYTSVFPQSELDDKMQLENVLRIAKSKYPNLRIAYLSSRTYGGYASKTDTNVDDESAPGKLHAYQSAWVAKWVIEDQVAGVGNLNADPTKGAVVAPWVAWGPYFWADGTTYRSDGLVWVCNDFGPDGVHPNNNGVKKVADRLLAHFKSDSTACSWFTTPGYTCPSGGNPGGGTPPPPPPPPPVGDTVPPAVISDLRGGRQTQYTINLRWSAVGDDGMVGTAAGYDVRLSTVAISDATWEFALQASQEPFPLYPGSKQSFVVSDLLPKTTYWLAIKTYDEAGNYSGISNVVSVQTK